MGWRRNTPVIRVGGPRHLRGADHPPGSPPPCQKRN